MPETIVPTTLQAWPDHVLLSAEVRAWREAARCAQEYNRKHDRSIHTMLRDSLLSANEWWHTVRAERERRGLIQTQTVA
jgi:hypothetical protein